METVFNPTVLCIKHREQNIKIRSRSQSMSYRQYVLIVKLSLICRGFCLGCILDLNGRNLVVFFRTQRENEQVQVECCPYVRAN